MIKLIFKTIGVTLLVGYLLIAGVVYGFWREKPRYRGIKIDITYPDDQARFIKEDNIMRLVNSKPGFKAKGKLYNEVNTLELAQYIEENNRLVRRAICYHTPDSLLRIDIEQRNPVLRVKSDVKVRDTKGNALQDFYVDFDSEMMPAQLGNSVVNLPLVTGHVRQQDVQPLRDFAIFLKDDDFWCDNITQIYLQKNGDVELVPRIGDHTILLGSLEGYKKKLDHVRTFYNKVMPVRGWNTYSRICVKYNGQVIGEK